MSKAFARWAPLLGGVILIAGVVLPIFGQSELAVAITGLGSLLGLTAQSPVSVGEVSAASVAVTSAVALAWGVIRKLLAVAKPK